MDPLLEEGLKNTINSMFGPGVYVNKKPIDSNGYFAQDIAVESIFKNAAQFVPVPPITIDDPDSIEIMVQMLTGKIVPIQCKLDDTIDSIKRSVHFHEGVPPDQQRFIFDGKQLEDGRTASDYNVRDGSTVHMILRCRGGGCAARRIDPSQFDPKFDFDFRKINDIGKLFMRGDREYFRPIGSRRYALKVLDKYEDNKWLGADGITRSGEWPVAYHGTQESNALNVN